MKTTLLLSIGILVLTGIGLAYLFTQQPRFYVSMERTGFALLNGRYRSYLWSWCDGWIPEAGGKMTPFCDQPDGSIVRGYRWMPRFRHVDMKNVVNP